MSTTTDQKIRIEAEHLVKAPASDVYTCLADYQEHHPRILPGAFSTLVVERGGVGSGTVFSVSLKLAGKKRTMRAVIEEPDPGSVLEEINLENDMVTTFEVTPQGASTHAGRSVQGRTDQSRPVCWQPGGRARATGHGRRGLIPDGRS